MKRYSTYTAWLFIVGLVLIACSKKGSGQPGLTGTWNWTLTAGGIAGMQYTPASTGTRSSVTFNSDRTFKMYINDTLRFTGTFSTETRTCIHDRTKKLFYIFSNSLPGGMVEKLTADSLEFSDENYDGYGHCYTRAGR